jgi:hypothetical protein
MRLAASLERGSAYNRRQHVRMPVSIGAGLSSDNRPASSIAWLRFRGDLPSRDRIAGLAEAAGHGKLGGTHRLGGGWSRRPELRPAAPCGGGRALLRRLNLSTRLEALPLRVCEGHHGYPSATLLLGIVERAVPHGSAFLGSRAGDQAVDLPTQIFRG